MCRLPLVHAGLTALVDHAPTVAQQDVVRRQSHRLEQFHTRDRRRAGAVDDHPDVVNPPIGQMHCVHQARSGDDRGAVLVIVEDGDVHQFPQAGLDDETVRCLDIFKVHAAKAGAKIAHALHECVDVRGIDLQIDAVDVCEPLEEDSLALHHRLRAKRTEIPKPQHGCAV